MCLFVIVEKAQCVVMGDLCAPYYQDTYIPAGPGSFGICVPRSFGGFVLFLLFCLQGLWKSHEQIISFSSE